MSTTNNDSDSQACQYVKPRTTFSLLQESGFEFVTTIFNVWVVATFFNFALDFKLIYTYYIVGLYCSSLATYYKFKIWYDPSYKPGCNCAGDTPTSTMNSTLNVL